MQPVSPLRLPSNTTRFWTPGLVDVMSDTEESNIQYRNMDRLAAPAEATLPLSGNPRYVRTYHKHIGFWKLHHERHTHGIGFDDRAHCPRSAPVSDCQRGLRGQTNDA